LRHGLRGRGFHEEEKRVFQQGPDALRGLQTEVEYMTASVRLRVLAPLSLDIFGGSIYVANFAQEVVKGSCPWLWEGLGSQGVEQFGRSAALVSLFDHQLSFLDHGHECDPDERGLRRVKRFES
jgi:hypothetical protein